MITETEVILAFVLNLLVVPTVGVWLIVKITNKKLKSLMEAVKNVGE